MRAGRAGEVFIYLFVPASAESKGARAREAGTRPRGTPGAQSSGRGSLPAQLGAWLVSAQRGAPAPDASPPPPLASVGAGAGRTSRARARGWERFGGHPPSGQQCLVGCPGKLLLMGDPVPRSLPSALLAPWPWREVAMACGPPTFHTHSSS